MKSVDKWIVGILAVLVVILLGGAVFQVKVAVDMREEITALKEQKKTLESDIKSEEEAIKLIESEMEETEEPEEPQDGTGQEEQEAGAVQDAAPVEGNGRKVAIDPGHQGYHIDMSELEPVGPGSQEMKPKGTQGTQGSFTGVPEYELNLTISKQLAQELQGRGYEVMLTRQDNDTVISNQERALLAAEFGADIYLRIHANESGNPDESGALTMVPSANNPYIAQLHNKSYALGEAVINAYCQSCGLTNRGVMFSDNMAGTNWSQVPVTVLEMGFMTNQSDDIYMQNAEFQSRMVQGIANGVDQYFAAGN